MASRFDTFSKLIAGPSSSSTGFRLPGAALVSSAVRAFTGREATDASPFADACRGYDGIDYINCLHDAEVQARGGEPGVLRVDTRPRAQFNAVSPARFNAMTGARFNAVNAVRFNGVNDVRFNAATSVRFNAVKSVRFNAVTSTRFNAVTGVRFNAVTAGSDGRTPAGIRR